MNDILNVFAIWISCTRRLDAFLPQKEREESKRNAALEDGRETRLKATQTRTRRKKRSHERTCTEENSRPQMPRAKDYSFEATGKTERTSRTERNGARATTTYLGKVTLVILRPRAGRHVSATPFFLFFFFFPFVLFCMVTRMDLN